MAVTIAMFIAFARGRYREEIISLVTIAVIAVGLYFAPLPGTRPTGLHWPLPGSVTRR